MKRLLLAAPLAALLASAAMPARADLFNPSAADPNNGATAAALGKVDDTAWSGAGPATISALLKGIFGQLLAAPKPVSGAATGGDVAVGTSPTTIVPASTSARYVEFQVQGSVPVCASFVTAAVSISTDANGVTQCTGAGAFLYGPLGYYRSPGPALPNTVLTAIAATAGKATIKHQEQ